MTTIAIMADEFFTSHQQRRLRELMERWRTALASHAALPPEEQAELEVLVEAEVQAAAKRAEALTGGVDGTVVTV